LLLFIALALGTAYGWVSRSKMMMSLLQTAIVPKDPRVVFGNTKSVTLLMLGCDEERKWGGVASYGTRDWTNKPGEVTRKYARADMILVARLDFEQGMITGISIPRDTDVRLPGYRSHRINTYFKLEGTEKGPEMMQKAVTHALDGVPIDRVVVLNYDAFQEMVDSVGGVAIDVPKKMDYDDHAGNVHIHLEPGRQRLSGYDALMYVRYRKSNDGAADTDFDRQNRQKQFLVSFKDAVMRDPLKLPTVFDKAVDVLGNSMNEDEIASLAFFAKSVKPNQIRMGMLPVRERRGTTRLAIDTRKLPAVLEEYNLKPKAPHAVRSAR
jgi:LCP family protein required for cell wall assembly